jgi:inhibitor of KinA sporulation pathway (predicted exonuclease)
MLPITFAGHYPFNFASEIQHYVRPKINPKLTDFCKNLTAITQTQVDNGCDLREMLHLYDAWLRGNNLVVRSSHPSKSGTNTTAQSPTFCIITWGDSDIGTILKEQCKRLDIELPAYFHEWINLKALFKQHFGWEPRGGLQNVVERCGCAFEGRAHSGLVDSRNTAKIVQKMLQEGFRFTRATRNIHAYKPR